MGLGDTGSSTSDDTASADADDADDDASGDQDAGSDGADAQCGDEQVQADEDCDGDMGCSDTCEWSEATEAFRVTKLDVLDPPLRTPGECGVITNLANLALNTALNNDDTTDPEAPGYGALDLSPVLLFYPVRTEHATGHFGIATGRCTVEPTTCTLEPDSPASNSTYANLVSGTCLQADPTELAEGAIVPESTAPCMVAPSTSITLDFRPFPLQLQALGISGRFDGTPPDRIVNGLLRGFVLESTACDPANEIAPSYPVVGGATIGEMLAGGPIECGGCQELDDSDEGPQRRAGVVVLRVLRSRASAVR